MERREFLKATGMAATVAALPQLARAAQSEERKPNIVLIMTDDQGWGDIHSHGNDVLDTPVLDQLAAGGARFDRFYVSPVCAPTRASLLTGRYSARSGVWGVTRGRENMRSDETTFAEVFRAAGYATGCFGKWHNGAHYPYHPNGQGFDEFFGFCGGHWNNYFDTHLERNGVRVETEGYITDVLTDAAIEFIEKNRERPFLCYIPYNAPHGPWQVPDKYFDKYKAKGLDDKTACAYGMVENLDDNVKRILQRLDQLKLTDDTIVIFLTDNGPNSDRYNGGMRGRKGSTDEGGIRVPFFIRWPGHIEAGKRVETIAAHIDVLPTLVELAGVPMGETKPLDGLSLVPLLDGETGDWPDRKLFSRWGRRGGVRTQQWRATRQGDNWRLYNMIADPNQENDVAKENPVVLRELSAAYDAWEKDVTRAGFDPIPIPIGYPERPVVTMPGHEAFLQPAQGEGISYVGASGWANDYVTNWTDVDAYPLWEVEVVNPGTYHMTLLYTATAESLGTKLRVEIGGQATEGTLTKEHDPKNISSPDRVPRGEVYEKVWAPLELGTVTLEKGKTQLAVKALNKPGHTVMELKAVRVRKVK